MEWFARIEEENYPNTFDQDVKLLSKNIELRRHESSFPFVVRDHQSLRYGNPSGDENERNYAKQVWKH